MGGLLKQYLWIVNILVILFCSYFAARIVNVYVGKAMEVHRAIGVLKRAEKKAPIRVRMARSDYNVITERDIFDSSEALPPEPGVGTSPQSATYVPGQEAVKTSLPVKLFAVLVIGEGKDKRSSATISMGAKSVDVYSVKGDKTFSSGVMLVQIKPDRIEFVNKGRLEYAKLAEGGAGSIFGPPGDELTKVATKSEVKASPAAAVKMEDGKYLIDQAEIDNALANLDRLYTEIRAVPNFQDGKVSGMKVLSVKPGSLFAKLGLKRGDILSRINGIELDVRKGFDIFNQLKNQREFNVDLVRRGTAQTFEYEIR
jgi:general secretion pathway protein C